MTEQPRQLPGQDQAVAAMKHLQLLSAQRKQARPATEAEIDALDEAIGKCSHCGGYHVRACPRVRKIEWHPNNMIASVEFWPALDVDWSGVIFEDTDSGDDTGDVQVDESDLDLVLRWLEDPDTEKRLPPSDGRINAVRRLRLVLEEQQAVQSTDGSEPA
jgi:hypothetical protein